MLKANQVHKHIYTIPKKIKPISKQESCCIINLLHPPSMCTVHKLHWLCIGHCIPTVWYKTVKQYFLMVCHGISYLSLVFSWYTQSPKGLSVCQEKVTWKRCITSMNLVLTGSNTNILQSKWTASCVAWLDRLYNVARVG